MRKNRTSKLGASLALTLIFVASGCGRSGDTSSGSESESEAEAEAESEDGSSPAEFTETLPPPEVFEWDDQPISFSPPPAGWERHRQQSAGLRGVRFVKARSVGERIHVAEYYEVGDRDRCTELEALLRDLDELDQRGFSKRLQRARPFARKPINSFETLYFEAAKRRLDEASSAFRGGNEAVARREIGGAIAELKWVVYSLDEVVEPAMFSEEDLDSFGEVVVGEPEATQVGGEPGIKLDYTLDSRERPGIYHGREVYVAYNNRLFVAGFMGLEKNLPLFDAIVETISFPEGKCAH